MNPLYRKVALKVHDHPFLYNKSIRNHICTLDRDAVFIRIRDEILEDPDFAHFAVAWADDELVVKRRWRTIRSKYCALQLQLINQKIDEIHLTVGEREFLITLSFLEPFVQHIHGEANIGIEIPNERREQLLQEALEDYLGDNEELIQEVFAQLQARGNVRRNRRAAGNHPGPPRAQRHGNNRRVRPQDLPLARQNHGNRRVRR